MTLGKSEAVVKQYNGGTCSIVVTNKRLIAQSFDAAHTTSKIRVQDICGITYGYQENKKTNLIPLAVVFLVIAIGLILTAHYFGQIMYIIGGVVAAIGVIVLVVHFFVKPQVTFFLQIKTSNNPQPAVKINSGTEGIIGNNDVLVIIMESKEVAKQLEEELGAVIADLQ